MTTPDGVGFRVWPDGTIQAVEGGEPYTWMSDDFVVIKAGNEDDALAQATAQYLGYRRGVEHVQVEASEAMGNPNGHVVILGPTRAGMSSAGFASNLPDAARLMRDTGSCWPSPAPATKGEVQEFQWRVRPWLLHCFGPEVAADPQERNHRFMEESVELVQSLGCTASEAHQLVDYVFGRPVGEPAQEVGGVMVTLAALCLANRLDMHVAGDVELARVSEPAMTERVRAKQASKPRHSPLPGATPESLSARKEITMEDAFELQYRRDWNDPSGDEMKAVWSAAWLAAKSSVQRMDEGKA